MTDTESLLGKLNELEKLAKKATQGSWIADWDDFSTWVQLDDRGPGISYICQGMHQGINEGEDDATYIAAVQPRTILWLIEEVRNLIKEKTDGGSYFLGP